MALDAISSTDLLNFLIYESICGTNTSSSPLKHANAFQDDYPIFDHHPTMNVAGGGAFPSQDATTAVLLPPLPPSSTSPPPSNNNNNSCFHEESAGSRKTPCLAVQGRKKRRRRPKICKNKEEAETQRMTHIVVERNRRKQMNEHLAVLRSLMPESYAQRGDQASIVGGAIEYVKQLEHLLQSLEAKKLAVNYEQDGAAAASTAAAGEGKAMEAPFAEFFTYPQYTWSQSPNKHNSKTAASVADIEVTLIESHANLRILSKKRPRQLSKLVAGFQVLRLSILHLNVTSFDPLVLYSISAKVEEGCQLTSLDDIAEATHHMLRIIEEEAAIC